jgi:hypothetical protein
MIEGQQLYNVWTKAALVSTTTRAVLITIGLICLISGKAAFAMPSEWETFLDRTRRLAKRLQRFRPTTRLLYYFSRVARFVERIFDVMFGRRLLSWTTMWTILWLNIGAATLLSGIRNIQPVTKAIYNRYVEGYPIYLPSNTTVKQSADGQNIAYVDMLTPVARIRGRLILSKNHIGIFDFQFLSLFVNLTLGYLVEGVLMMAFPYYISLLRKAYLWMLKKDRDSIRCERNQLRSILGSHNQQLIDSLGPSETEFRQLRRKALNVYACLSRKSVAILCTVWLILTTSFPFWYSQLLSALRHRPGLEVVIDRSAYLSSLFEAYAFWARVNLRQAASVVLSVLLSTGTIFTYRYILRKAISLKRWANFALVLISTFVFIGGLISVPKMIAVGFDRFSPGTSRLSTLLPYPEVMMAASFANMRMGLDDFVALSLATAFLLSLFAASLILLFVFRLAWPLIPRLLYPSVGSEQKLSDYKKKAYQIGWPLLLSGMFPSWITFLDILGQLKKMIIP